MVTPPGSTVSAVSALSLVSTTSVRRSFGPVVSEASCRIARVMMGDSGSASSTSSSCWLMTVLSVSIFCSEICYCYCYCFC